MVVSCINESYRRELTIPTLNDDDTILVRLEVQKGYRTGYQMHKRNQYQNLQGGG